MSQKNVLTTTSTGSGSVLNVDILFKIDSTQCCGPPSLILVVLTITTLFFYCPYDKTSSRKYLLQQPEEEGDYTSVILHSIITIIQS